VLLGAVWEVTMRRESVVPFGVCSATVPQIHGHPVLAIGWFVTTQGRALGSQDRGRNLNSSIVLEYIRQVMAICDEAVEEATSAFNDRVQQIDLLTPSKQNEIYSSMGGRQASGIALPLFPLPPPFSCPPTFCSTSHPLFHPLCCSGGCFLLNITPTLPPFAFPAVVFCSTSHAMA
jgi:hypothetical protein